MEQPFAELFCRHRGLPPEQYRRAMLRCCLHHRTLIFLPFLAFFFPHYFDADNELIAAVGLLRTPETLDDEIHCFYDHPANRRFLRRKLHLRISVRRVRREFFALIERTAVKST